VTHKGQNESERLRAQLATMSQAELDHWWSEWWHAGWEANRGARREHFLDELGMVVMGLICVAAAALVIWVGATTIAANPAAPTSDPLSTTGSPAGPSPHDGAPMSLKELQAVPSAVRSGPR
jgi:hypothetical protein